MSAAAPRIAFHAPLKPPDHPTPSGDRRIARLTLDALRRAGCRAEIASRRRSLDLTGDPAVQARRIAEAEAEAAALIEAWRPDPPAAWLTYHCYWKAPDLLGPLVAAALNLPYLITEPSLSPRRREGPWAAYAAAAEAAIRAADALLWTTRRDLPMLEAAGLGARLTALPAFLDPGPAPAPRAAEAAGPLRLLAAGMMRPGDKLASYRALAAALGAARALDWRLEIAGDGAARAEVEAAFSGFGGRVRFLGALEADGLGEAFARAELLVWPGVGEGVGMIFLEAQAAGLPALAEDRPGPRDVVFAWRALPPPGAPEAFAEALAAAAADRAGLRRAGAAARRRVEAAHSLDAAAARLAAVLQGLGVRTGAAAEDAAARVSAEGDWT
ncbi:MAG: glycosyltransferase [Pseudomonadota bacterium]